MDMVEFTKKLKLNNQGIGLIETLLAIVFSISLILALVTLTNFNIRNSILVDENQKAINSANKLIESLRALKDTSFSAFLTQVSTANDCVNVICTVDNDKIIPATVDLERVSPYSYFKVEVVSTNEIKINTTTEWKIGSKSFSSPLSTTFSNWRSRN